MPNLQIIKTPTLVRGMSYYTGPIFELKIIKTAEWLLRHYKIQNYRTYINTIICHTFETKLT